MVTKYFYKFFSFFFKKPTKKLNWTVEDYEKGKKWAKTQPHPHSRSLTLWDHVHDECESTYTINNLNKFL